MRRAFDVWRAIDPCAAAMWPSIGPAATYYSCTALFNAKAGLPRSTARSGVVRDTSILSDSITQYNGIQ